MGHVSLCASCLCGLSRDRGPPCVAFVSAASSSVLCSGGWSSDSKSQCSQRRVSGEQVLPCKQVLRCQGKAFELGRARPVSGSSPAGMERWKSPYLRYLGSLKVHVQF